MSTLHGGNFQTILVPCKRLEIQPYAELQDRQSNGWWVYNSIFFHRLQQCRYVKPTPVSVAACQACRTKHLARPIDIISFIRDCMFLVGFGWEKKWARVFAAALSHFSQRTPCHLIFINLIRLCFGRRLLIDSWHAVLCAIWRLCHWPKGVTAMGGLRRFLCVGADRRRIQLRSVSSRAISGWF